MDFHNPQFVLTAYIISNIVALIMLWCSWKKSGIARLLYFLLFVWASFTNGRASLYMPLVYLEYADYAIIDLYKNFILGFFSEHTALIAFFFAVCQFSFGVSMLMKGMVFRLGAIGGMIFLVSILPLGVGAACPATLIMAVGLYLLLKKNISNYVWQFGVQKKSQ